MANFSTNELKVLSETVLFSPLSKSLSSKSDYSCVHEDHYSWRYLAKAYSKNSKSLRNSASNVSIKENQSSNRYKNLPGAMPIIMSDMFKAQNSNAPWLLKIFSKKFYRSRKHKNDAGLSKDVDRIDSMTLAEGLLEKPITNDGSHGRWIIKDKDAVCPYTKNSDTSTYDRYNISRALSSSTSPKATSTENSLQLRHYRYDFQAVDTQLVSSPSFLTNYASSGLSVAADNIQQESTNDERANTEPILMMSMTDALPVSNQEETNVQKDREQDNSALSSNSSSKEQSSIDHVYMTNVNSAVETKLKRTKSSSATRNRRVINTTSMMKDKGQSVTTRKKKSKYYEKHTLSHEEIELREALRIIDLDNIGFFPPNELRQALRNIGIDSDDIGKIEQCLPLDDDGHYSMDNLVRLLLTSKSC